MLHNLEWDVIVVQRVKISALVVQLFLVTCLIICQEDHSSELYKHPLEVLLLHDMFLCHFYCPAACVIKTFEALFQPKQRVHYESFVVGFCRQTIKV